MQIFAFITCKTAKMFSIPEHVQYYNRNNYRRYPQVIENAVLDNVIVVLSRVRVENTKQGILSGYRRKYGA